MIDKKALQNISEASAAKWRKLHELEAENVRLREAIRTALTWFDGFESVERFPANTLREAVAKLNKRGE